MEAKPRLNPVHNHRPIISRNSCSTSPPSSSHRRDSFRHGNARARSGLPMRHLSAARRTTLNTLTAVGSKFRQNRIPRFSPDPVADMATREPTEKDTGKERDDNNKVEAKDGVAPPRHPPPPEQPEPGDCCGSGCVRCVWDVYYEELEAYNKLYGSNPSSGPS